MRITESAEEALTSPALWYWKITTPRVCVPGETSSTDSVSSRTAVTATMIAPIPAAGNARRTLVSRCARNGPAPPILAASSIEECMPASGPRTVWTTIAANAVTWAKEFGVFGIRAVAIAPGMVETPMTQGMNPKAREALVEKIPVGRIGTTEDLWLGIKFAIECEYLNGTTIDIDGGAKL